MLASKLQALQSLIFHAAAAVAPQPTVRRGLWYNRYREAVELLFKTAHHSDLVIEVETPTPGPTLLPENDVALESIDLIFRVGNQIQNNAQQISSEPLRATDRNYLLRAFDWLAPGPLDEYSVELENSSPGRHPKLILSTETRRTIRMLIEQETAPQVAEQKTTLVGELVKIHFGTGPELIAIRHRGIEIECYYSESLRDEVANLMVGSYVEVTGLATVDQEGRIKKIDTVTGIETVSMEPLRMTRLDHSGFRLDFKTPVQVQVEYTDGLWVYRNEALNLLGCGERREDALKDLHANFAYLWQEFAEEEDRVLDSNALMLKRRLIGLQSGEHLAH